MNPWILLLVQLFDLVLNHLTHAEVQEQLDEAAKRRANTVYETARKAKFGDSTE